MAADRCTTAAAAAAATAAIAAAVEVEVWPSQLTVLYRPQLQFLYQNNNKQQHPASLTATAMASRSKVF